MELSRSDLLVILEIINQCLCSRTSDDILTLFDKLKYHIDLSGMLLCQQESLDVEQLPSSTLLGAGVGGDWVNHYIDNCFFTADPILSTALNTESPVLWSNVYADNKDCEHFRNQASDFGLTEGITLASGAQKPGQPTTIVSVFNNQSLTDRDKKMLFHIIPHLNEALKSSPRKEKKFGLTPREIEALNWAKEGKSYWETSKIMNISERTVKFHSQNIYRKLDVSNRAQSISKALRLGIIPMM